MGEFTTHDGRKVIDGISSLWCVGAGHNRKPINEAIKKQLDAARWTTPRPSRPATTQEEPSRGREDRPRWRSGDWNKVLFCNSGSEAADTSLKAALAYRRARGEGHRNVFIGREKAITAWVSAA